MALSDLGRDGDGYVLVVEDDPLVRHLLITVLKLEGYDTESVNSGRAAKEAIELRRPALLLLDLVIPDTDGWQLMQDLRGDESTLDIPVLVVSSVGNLDHEARRASADDYLAKPFRIEVLLQKIAALLARTSRTQLSQSSAG